MCTHRDVEPWAKKKKKAHLVSVKVFINMVLSFSSRFLKQFLLFFLVFFRMWSWLSWSSASFAFASWFTRLARFTLQFCQLSVKFCALLGVFAWWPTWLTWQWMSSFNALGHLELFTLRAVRILFAWVSPQVNKGDWHLTVHQLALGELGQNVLEVLTLEVG